MIKKTHFLTIVMLVCLVLILAPLNAQATTLTFGLDYLYCAHAPDGTAPWLTATFDDHGTTGTVDLKLSSSGLVNEEFVASWYFNLDPVLDDCLGTPASNLGGLSTNELNIQPAGTGSIYNATKISAGLNSFHAASDGAFDILFDFSQNASDNCSLVKRFTKNITLEYTITGTGSLSNLSAQFFNFLSEANGSSDNRIFYSAAHVLRSPLQCQGGSNCPDPDCTCSYCCPNQACGWIAAPIPEPCTMILLGSGLISMAGFIRKSKK